MDDTGAGSTCHADGTAKSAFDEITCARCMYSNRGSARHCAWCGMSLQRSCSLCDHNDHIPKARYCEQCGRAISKTKRIDHWINYPHRRQLTVMFCDIIGYTQLSLQLDQEELRRILRSYQAICSKTVSCYGGRVTRYVGDGVLSLFSYPQAHDDDAVRAVFAANDIIRKLNALPDNQPNVRVGIATGVVIVGDVIGDEIAEQQSIVGETPNLASRLQGLAKPNTIVISRRTYRLVREAVACQSMGKFQLRGYTKAVEVYQATPDATPYGSYGGVKDRKRSLFVGRRKELSVLKKHCFEASCRRGNAVLIQGDAGIGKTRIVEELVFSREAEKFTAMTFQCSHYHLNTALHPVVHALQHYLEISVDDVESDIWQKLRNSVGRGRELPVNTEALVRLLSPLQQPDNETETSSIVARSQPHEAIVNYLVQLSRARPLLLIIEDLQWTDPSSLKFLECLCQSIKHEAIATIITARSDYGLEKNNLGGGEFLSLDRLESDDAERLIRSLLSNVNTTDQNLEKLQNNSDGVPLFIEEMSKTYGESEIMGRSADVNVCNPVPETLRDSLMARLDRCGSSKFVAQIAAVIGRYFSYDLVKAVSQLTDRELQDHLTSLISMGILNQDRRGDKLSYAFRHSLIHEIAYASLLRSKQTVYHGCIVDYLRSNVISLDILSTDGIEKATILAHHCRAAGRYVEAANLWCSASAEAISRCAYVEAERHAKAGLALVDNEKIEQTDDQIEMLFNLRINYARSLLLSVSEETARVEKAFNAALVLCAEGNIKNGESKVLRGLYGLCNLRGPIRSAVSYANQLMEVEHNNGNPKLINAATRCLGWSLFCSGSLNEGGAFVAKAVAGVCTDEIDNAQCEQYFDGTIDVGLANLCWIRWFQGSFVESKRVRELSLSLARKSTQPFGIAYAMCTAAAVHQCENQPKSVIELIHEVAPILEKHGLCYWLAWSNSLKGWALAKTGDSATGIAMQRDALDDYRHTGAIVFLPHILCMLAESLHDNGDCLDALRAATQAVDCAIETDSVFYLSEALRLLAVIQFAVGNRADAHSHCTRALTVARQQNAGALVRRILDTENCINAQSSLVEQVPGCNRTVDLSQQFTR